MALKQKSVKHIGLVPLLPVEMRH